MKFIFLGSFLLLSLSAVVTWRLSPEGEHALPVLYWVTDDNPARVEQVATFRRWLAVHHPDQQFELNVDAANVDGTKRIIECVSGDGDDVVDLFGGGEVRFFQQMGVLKDITDDARRLGFGPDQTWAALKAQIMVPLPDGSLRQFVYPTNCTAQQYFVNLQAFRKYGLAPPPSQWSLEEFERIGKAFVAAANPDPRHRLFFFADSIPGPVLRRSLGPALSTRRKRDAFSTAPRTFNNSICFTNGRSWTICFPRRVSRRRRR